MSPANIVVLKFGSSVLRTERDLPQVVHEIYRLWRRGERVVVVVSAFGDTTDELLGRATGICAEPDEVVLASLLATGETTASALLALALQRAGIPVKVFDAAQAGLRTTGSVTDAELLALDTERLPFGLQQFVIQKSGMIFFYQNSVAVDSQACFIVASHVGSFLVGQMLMMPPAGQTSVRLVKVYEKIWSPGGGGNKNQKRGRPNFRQ